MYNAVEQVNDEYASMLFYFADCITYVCRIRHGKPQKKSHFKLPFTPEKIIVGFKDGKFMVLLFYTFVLIEAGFFT